MKVTRSTYEIDLSCWDCGSLLRVTSGDLEPYKVAEGLTIEFYASCICPECAATIKILPSSLPKGIKREYDEKWN